MTEATAPAASSGRPELDAARTTQIVAFLGDQRKTQSNMRFQLSNGDAEQLQLLAAALPGLLEASTERDNLKKEREAVEERVTAWLTNLRAAMPGQSCVSPTGESIVGTALGQLYELQKLRETVTRLTSEKAAVQEDLNTALNAGLATGLAASQFRARSLTEIEALPVYKCDNIGHTQIVDHLDRDEVRRILRGV